MRSIGYGGSDDASNPNLLDQMLFGQIDPEDDQQWNDDGTLSQDMMTYLMNNGSQQNDNVIPNNLRLTMTTNRSSMPMNALYMKEIN